MTDTQFVRGAEKLQRRIATIRANLHLPLLMEEIGSLLERRTLQRFDREVDPDGKPWASLKPSYAKRKAKESGNTKILVRRGDLRASIRRIRGGFGFFAINTGADRKSVV